MELIQDRFQWQALALAAMNRRFLQGSQMVCVLLQ